VPGDRRAPKRLDRLLLLGTVAAGALFATGVPSAPHSSLAFLVYDLVLFNAVPLGAAALCWRAGRRVRTERVAWRAVGAAWALSVVGNLLFVTDPSPGTDFPSLAELAYLAVYPLIAVHLLALVHVRVPRFRPTTWLDGAVGALGVTAVVATFVLAPWLDVAGLEANAATLTYPVTDVLLLALVAAVITVRGLHSDRTVLLLSVAFVAKPIGDVLLTRAQAQGTFVLAGPIDLCWVVAALITGAAAVLARPQHHDEDPAPDLRARTGWRTLGLPLMCNLGSLAVLASEWGKPGVSVGEVSALGCLLAALIRTAVTFQEIRSLHEMRLQAATDDLTGLPNRRALLVRLGQQLRTGRPAALLLLDLDGFKSVNDGVGHHAGDQLLQELGERIRPALRPTDVLARLGGDEFAALLPGVALDDARDCAVRIHELVCRPVTVAGVRVRVGASIGVVSAPDQADDVTDLLRFADAAMYAAKSAHGGVRVYTPDLDSPRRSRPVKPLGTPSGVRTELRFRPLTRADAGVVGAEGLALGPAGTEAAESVLPMLSEVLEAAAGWASQVHPVWIGLSADELTRPRLADRLTTALLRSGLPPEALVVRLRQSDDPPTDDVATALSGLRARGIRTAVDVGGAGPLALVGLRDLPADWIRLSPHLTRDVFADPRLALTVEHTVALARGLGTVVLTEGVDGSTAAWLAERGCEVLAGESAVLTAGQVDGWLRSETGAGRPTAAD
jgi:diguanylate cyclase